MFIDVTAVTSAPRTTVLVPLVSIRRSPQGQHVFVLGVEDGKLRARQRTVQTGPVVNDEIAIDTGLVVGDLIAASGSFKLRDGALVQAEDAARREQPDQHELTRADMRAIEIFVRRPVLAIVVNLALVLIGLRAATQLPVQQYPRIESSSIIITTIYVGRVG